MYVYCDYPTMLKKSSKQRRNFAAKSSDKSHSNHFQAYHPFPLHYAVTFIKVNYSSA